MSERILLVDPDQEHLARLRAVLLANTGYEAHATTNPLEVAGLLASREFSLVLTALAMNQQSGLDLLNTIKSMSPDLPVVLVTAYPTVDAAVAAMKQGAFDFLQKPVEETQLLLTVERALQWRRRLVGRRPADEDEFELVPGASPAMVEIHRQVRLVADTLATVLITGESGTGKELVAKSLHLHSSRRRQPWVVVNCAALPDNLIESELFGHVKGSFSGALKDKQGLVAAAQGGTLFLDEIGDLSPNLQAKLLRLLQQAEYRPVGGTRALKADVRFIAATNHNLEAKVADGSFREDLYYRLNVIRLDIPPLRQRADDIPALAIYFLDKYSRLYGIKNMRIGPRTMAILQSRAWPGNVREMENVLKRAVILCRGLNIQSQDLFPLPEQPSAPAASADQELWTKPYKDAKDEVLEDFTRSYVEKLLARHQGNVSRAAEASGIKRQYLHKIMKQAGVSAASFKQG
ncbi:MAG: sigma-54 dependent transcriptional regulator [Pseudomonadota bacterium]